jgi:hypothetical protein
METVTVRMGVMVIGKACIGKTTVIQTLKGALDSIAEKE